MAKRNKKKSKKTPLLWGALGIAVVAGGLSLLNKKKESAEKEAEENDLVVVEVPENLKLTAAEMNFSNTQPGATLSNTAQKLQAVSGIGRKLVMTRKQADGLFASKMI